MAVETEQFGPSHMLFGIEAAARQAGHLLSFVTLNRNGSDMATTLERLRASHVQGVIVVAPVRRVVDAVARIEGAIPLVVVGGDPGMGAPTVTIDQFEGARMATRHLLDLGHRTVHHVAGPADLGRCRRSTDVAGPTRYAVPGAARQLRRRRLASGRRLCRRGRAWPVTGP